MRLGLWGSLCIVALGLATSVARAEPVLLHLEADGMMGLPGDLAGSDGSEPQLDLFAPGATLSAGVSVPLARWVLLGARVRGGMLFDGDAPQDPGRADPGIGSLYTLTANVRLRPFGGGPQRARGTGFFLEGGGGGALTGDLTRGMFEAGLGYGFAVGGVDLAPVARYLQIVQPSQDDRPDAADARLVMIGLEVTLFDARPLPAAPPPPTTPPPDRDGDGIPDKDDACPDRPEDADGFEDEDGCPDEDNDGDGIPDVEDECPDVAEDVDGFEDEDGCPEKDNDGDGILDPEDQCPNEPETLNGNDDEDGCPDEGLIEMVNDRIVLEERVLFDFERARVKHRAWPVLDAIVELVRQHPEWVKVRVEGHADTRGDEEYNQSLSERRAQHVRQFLIEHGLPADMIEAVGYGSTRPRDLRDTEEAHQRNRRVEFVVVARRKPGEEPEVEEPIDATERVKERDEAPSGDARTGAEAEGSAGADMSFDVGSSQDSEEGQP